MINLNPENSLTIQYFEFLLEGFIQEYNYDITDIVDILLNYYDTTEKVIIDIIKKTKYAFLLEIHISDRTKNALMNSAINKMIFYLSEKNPDKDIVTIIQELDAFLSHESGIDASKYIFDAIKNELELKGQFFGFFIRQFRNIRPKSCNKYMMEIWSKK